MLQSLHKQTAYQPLSAGLERTRWLGAVGLAVIVGLALLALVLVGAIPGSVIP